MDGDYTFPSPTYLRERWAGKSKQYAEKIEQPEFTIALLGSCTINPVEYYLGGCLVQYDFNPGFHLAPYNQIIQTCLNCKKELPVNTKFAVILWRIEDVFLEQLEAFLNRREGSATFVNTKMALLKKAIDYLLENSSCSVIVGIPPYPQVPFISNFDLQKSLLLQRFYSLIIENFLSYLEQRPNLIAVDLNLIQRDVGMQTTFDARTWYIFKQPWTEKFWTRAAQEIARLIRALRIPSAKCIALDCDGVLWGDTIGEDGINGIKLGDDYPGIIYKEVQRYLLSLKEKGIFLTLLSKNNEQDVWEVFDRHKDMVLKRDHIATFSIGWQPKYKGIQKIAADLNIGLESIVFIDDNPFEIEEVKRFCLQVRCLARPKNLLDYIEHLKKWVVFDSLKLTEEDYRRNEMIRSELRRKEIQSKSSYQEFLDTLNLQIAVEEISETHIDRVVQLLNKTNQFNLTSRRYTEKDILDFVKDPRYSIFVVSAKDVFGDYGIIGTAIGLIVDTTFMLDSFLLSCRALGREIETAFLSVIAEQAKRLGAKNCRAEFIPTAKNKPAEKFLLNHGFKQDGKGFWWLDLAHLPVVPAHIKLLTKHSFFTVNNGLKINDTV